jgi:anti-sigma factor RsiW
MNRRLELDLMRLLHGELPEERVRELRAQMEREPALAQEYRRLLESWEDLALPPTAPVPPGFAQRVAAHARTEQAVPTPGWVRAAAALALILGTAVGAGVGGAWPLRETAQEVRTVDEEELSAVDGSLAESYLTTLEDLEP